MTKNMDMWPRGRLRKTVSNQALYAERRWQVEWMEECARVDGKGSGRVKSARDNIRQIDAELDRRAKEDADEEKAAEKALKQEAGRE